MKKKVRHNSIKVIMDDLIREAMKKDYVETDIVKKDLDNLFSTPYFGFREITLVIGVASLLDGKYKASSGFYDCNPRPLYETSIRESLAQYSIPHRKSGPLNVAKSTQGINREWASQKKSKMAADSVVSLVELIESSSIDEIRNLMINLMSRLLDEAKKITEFEVELLPHQDPVFLYEVCKVLITEATDGGNTPQRIIGYLLSSYHEALTLTTMVSGHEDSAFATNTTSKKPGDIQEENEKLGIFNVYEVTLKKFDKQRIDDSFESIHKYCTENNTNLDSIKVICKKENCPSDINTNQNLNGYLGYVKKNNITYYFIEIFEWIAISLVTMPVEARTIFHKRMNDYVSKYNTSLKIKTLWQQMHITTSNISSSN